MGRGAYGHSGGERREGEDGGRRGRYGLAGDLWPQSSDETLPRRSGAVGCSGTSRGGRNYEKNPVLGEPKTLSAEPLNKSYVVLVFSSI